jgi:hypothetical protein
MSNPLKLLFLVFFSLLVFFLLWALSMASVFWDTWRRKQTGFARYGWVGLALLMPLVGCFAYWIVRLVAQYLQTSPLPPAADKMRFTQPMLVGAPEVVDRTIQGIDLVEPGPNPLPRMDEISTLDPPPKAGWRITINEGPEQGRQFRLTSLPQIIGRSSAAGILLGEDAMISRRHAELYDQQGVLYIRDMGSLHGTRVNDMPISARNLEAGDRIQVGGTVLLVQTSDG